jgi:acetyl-CoA carboxylase alpha subunit
MSRGLHRLPLEKPIYEIEDRIAALEAAPLGALQQEEVRRLKRELVEIQKRVFSGLDPWQTVEVARHPDRPKTSDYVSQVFDEFVELHGDRAFGDDPAMLTGFAKLEQHKVLVVGHQPTLGLAAALLMTELPQPWSVKKGAVWWLRDRDRVRDEGAHVVLLAVQPPDFL